MTLVVYRRFVQQTMHDDNLNETTIECKETNSNATTNAGDAIQQSSIDLPFIASPSNKSPFILNPVIVKQQIESQTMTPVDTENMTIHSEMGLKPSPSLDTQNRAVHDDKINGTQRIPTETNGNTTSTDLLGSQSNIMTRYDTGAAAEPSHPQAKQGGNEMQRQSIGSNSAIRPYTFDNILNQIDNRHTKSDSNDSEGLDQVSRDPPPQKALVATPNENVTRSVHAAHITSKSLLINNSSTVFNAEQITLSHNVVNDSKNHHSTSTMIPVLNNSTTNFTSATKTGNSELSSSSIVNNATSASASLHHTTNRVLPTPLIAHSVSDKSWKKPIPTIAKKAMEPQESIPVVDEKLVQYRRPLTDLYGPFLCHTTDASLQIARDRLRKAIHQTYALRKAFTDRVYTKYRVCLQPAQPPDRVITAILEDPKGSDKRLSREMDWIRDEKEIEKKETALLNAEMSASKQKKEELGNIDNAEQLMYFTAGLNLVILPEAQLPPEHHHIYSERCPINPITGHRVKDISQAAALAGEVIIDRARTAATMMIDRTKEQTMSTPLDSNTSVVSHRLPILSDKGLTPGSISSFSATTRVPLKVDSRLTAINPRQEYDSILKVPRTRHPALSISIPSLISFNPIFDELKSNNTKPGAATSWLIANSAYANVTKSNASRMKVDVSAGKRRFGNDGFDHKRIHDLQLLYRLSPTDSESMLPSIPIHKEGLERQPLDVHVPPVVVQQHLSSSLATIFTEFLDADRSRSTDLSAPKIRLLRKRKFTEEMQVQPPTINVCQRFTLSVLAAVGLTRMTQPSDVDIDNLLTPPVSKKLKHLLSEPMLANRSRLESSKSTVFKLVVHPHDSASYTKTTVADGVAIKRHIVESITSGSEVQSQAFGSNIEKQPKRQRLEDAFSDMEEAATNANICALEPTKGDVDGWNVFDGTSLSTLPVLLIDDQHQTELNVVGTTTVDTPKDNVTVAVDAEQNCFRSQPVPTMPLIGDVMPGKKFLDEIDFAFPDAPTTLSNEHAKFITLGQFHQVTSSISEMSLLSIALTYLRDVSRAIPISNTFLLQLVTRELDRQLAEILLTKIISVDIIVASIKAWVWANHYRFFKLDTSNTKIEIEQQRSRIIRLAVNVAMKALVLESSESMTKGVGAFSEANQALKFRVPGKDLRETIGLYCCQRLDLCVATVVCAALSEKVFIDPLLNSLLPNVHDALNSLDDARSLAFRSKARERTLLASFLSRTCLINETFSSSFVGSVVRAGQAFGHDQIFEEVQNESAVSSSMLPYDIFTEDNGLWENPTRPFDGFISGMTGKELYNRAHARAQLQMSLKRMQERHHVLGGVASRGPYGEVDANQYVIAGDTETAQEKTHIHSSSPRPSLKRRVSAIIESFFPPGTGSAAAKSASVYDPRHISTPLDWDRRSMARTPYGVHSWARRNGSSDPTTSETLVDPRVARPKPESASAAAISKRNLPRGNAPSSTREIAWKDVAEVFQIVKLSKRSATSRSNCSSMINTVDSKIYAPFFRPAEISANDRESDSGMSDEDLTDETVLKNHQLILDRMREGLDKVSEARKRQQETRRHRQK